MSSFLASLCFREQEYPYLTEDGRYQDVLERILAQDKEARTVEQNRCVAAWEMYRLLQQGEVEKVVTMPTKEAKGDETEFAAAFGFSLLGNMPVYTNSVELLNEELEFSSFTVLFWDTIEEKMDEMLEKLK